MSANGSTPFNGRGRRLPRAPSPEELAAFDLNDLGNAMRLVRTVGGDFDDDGQADLACARLLYLRDHGWIGFNGKSWDLQHGERQATRVAHKVAKDLFGQMRIRCEAAEADDKKVSASYLKSLRDFAEQAGNAGRTASMLKQAMAYLQVDLEDFDRDALAIAVQNGTLRFRRKPGGGGELQFDDFHEPADRITRIAAATYKPDASATLWRAKMAEWLPEPLFRDYVQRLTGYCATGSIEEQKFFIFQGLGNDGKSTFVGAIRDTLGQGEYAATADVKSFLDTGMRSAGDASPDMARLAGDTRLICVSEPQRNARLNDGMIKSFTGGAPVLARRLRMDPFEFIPRGKVVMECNNRPSPSGDDEGIWRRISLVLWRNPVPKDKVDKRLGAQLAEERSGILNWIVEGVLDWLNQGLAEPDEVASALDDYKKGSSAFNDWLIERTIFDREHLELASTLYADFKNYRTDLGDEKIMSQTAFGKALGDRQVLLAGKDPSGKVRRRGLKLRPAWDTSSDGVSAGGQTGGEAMSGEDLEDWAGR
jgi:putative DNA primase/helicase